MIKLNKLQKEWLDEKLKGFDVVYSGIHGSHLYGLAHKDSDIDVKVIYLPSKTDLILGDSIKTFNNKNDELDIEVEIKSLSSFLKSAVSCDTNCVDLLHSTEDVTLQTSPLWEEIKLHREGLYAKKMKGLVGYVKTHTHKYSNKIERLKEMKELAIVCDLLTQEYSDEILVRQVCDEMVHHNFKYIKVVTLVKDHEQQYLEVCGKKYIITWSIDKLISSLDHEISRYGKRSEDGLGKGMDTKSLSHAVRVLSEMEEVIEYRVITFPLRECDYIMNVKMNQVDLQYVLDDIDQRFEKVMSMLDESDLPDEVDLSKMYDVINKHYFG